MYRGHASLSLTDIEALFLEAVLDSMGNGPALLAEFIAFRRHDDFQTFGIADNERHRKRFGIHLRTHVRAEIVDDLVRTCNESADGSH